MELRSLFQIRPRGSFGCPQGILALTVWLFGCVFVGCDVETVRFSNDPVFAFRVEQEAGQSLELASQEVAQELGRLFGTPDQPLWPKREAEKPTATTEGDLAATIEASGKMVQLDRLQQAAGPYSSDENDNHIGLYRKHCVSCHGIDGNGRGPAARLLAPYPRNFQLGKFKYKSTPIGTPPTREDLKQLLVHGIPGSSMPAFNLLNEAELDALVDYVVYLSVRGEVERRLLSKVASEIDYAAGERLLTLDTSTGADAAQLNAEASTPKLLAADQIFEKVVEPWERSLAMTPEYPVVPADVAIYRRSRANEPEVSASIARGKSLYLGDVANCSKCHGMNGMGDGQLKDYDDWTKDWTVLAGLDPANRQQIRPLLKLGALKPVPSQPRNLRLGIFRGGPRPEDIYLRIVHGIEGTPMPAAALQPDNPLGLSERDVWDLVNYVLSLPDEPLSREMYGDRTETLADTTEEATSHE